MVSSASEIAGSRPSPRGERPPGLFPFLHCDMNLVVNGETRSLPNGASVADLVRELGLEKAACAVEVNKHLVPKAEHPKRPLGDGDSVEVVTLVGGG